MTDVFVPDADVVGTAGMGWAQIGQELAFERGGPDRWLSTYLVLEQYLREHDPAELDAAFVELLGSAVARFWGLRNLSLSVARAIDAHGQPSVQAALVKEMGTRFEQDLLESIRRFADVEPVPDSSSLFERLLANAILTAPVFTIRGGTIEILRSVAAKGLRAHDRHHRPAAVRDRDAASSPTRAPFAVVEQAEADGWAPTIWDAVAETGLAWVSVPEAAGGSGGTLADAIEVLRIAGRHAVPLPLAETGVLGGWLLAGAGLEIPDGAVTVVPNTTRDDLVLRDGALHGTAHRVPWARAVDEIVALLDTDEGPVVVQVDPRDVRIERGGEPRRRAARLGVPSTGVTPRAIARAAPGVDGDALRRRGALARTASMAGALERLEELTLEYTAARRQFGKPVGTFQAVQAHLVHGAQQSVMVSVALAAAVRAAESGTARFEIAAAKLLADQAASEATRHAHQAHGAMGMTREYPLHHVSRRLWAWRSEYGDERTMSRTLGEMVVDVGADRLYPLVSGGSEIADAAREQPYLTPSSSLVESFEEPMFRRPPLHYPERPLHHFLQDAADRHPEKIALRFEDDVYTYRELDSTGNSFANALLALGFGPGTRVALAITNRPEWIIAQHGVSLAGGAVVLPNPSWKASEFEHAFALTHPDVVVADAALAEVLDAAGAPGHAHLCRRRRTARVVVVLGPRVRHARAPPVTAAGEPRSTPTTRTRSARGRRACPRRCATPTGRWSRR